MWFSNLPEHINLSAFISYSNKALVTIMLNGTEARRSL
jgi:hypothetical protein